MLKIGKLKLKSNLILSPMAGITDLPFRMLCRRFGAEMAFVEMINCRSISHKNRRTKQMLASLPKDKPLGMQILGCEEQYILRALEVLRGYEFDLLDFNAACPSKKVVRRGEGSGLLKEPKKLKKILKLVVKNSWLPVTVKIRLGWDKDSVNAKDIALLAQDCGVNALFIHGRTKTQGYSGQVDYNMIREVKKVLDIPLIASGDIFSGLLAKKMLDETGCDGLAVARGSLGNPWIFKEIKEYLKSGKIINRPKEENIAKVLREHLDSSLDFYGERNGIVIFRKFYIWYTKGLCKVRRLRERSSRASTRPEVESIIQETFGK
ncbi:MAG: tRNA dihydrouridine synthase DusB [Candidatus Omnitrophica bacterium]|nr:tRNA dihydrouridine synthase DusB [Candidatus Omnitrophota bacterium]MBU4303694.1 tRNA dihydrouridine synthase DusB [Candidatus Omnitrophota bacterium]MBU4468452.1 tRNA dihydrouridine synthase DusB [Candidatus Omnitrophota bacterium]MCG2708444.1 tRNA dihydrouridine synthase DusB [Candidatus Omnitrophota bacterium]